MRATAAAPSRMIHPVTSGYVATLFKALGTDRVLAVEVHNEADFESGFAARSTFAR